MLLDGLKCDMGVGWGGGEICSPKDKFLTEQAALKIALTNRCFQVACAPHTLQDLASTAWVNLFSLFSTACEFFPVASALAKPVE